MRYQKEKFKNTVLYLTKYGGSNVGKKKLAKLLYFIDFTLYELRKKSLTEIVYAKKDYGPMPEPTVFYPALDELKNKKFIEIITSKVTPLEKIVPKKEPNMQIFDEKEIEVLKEVTEKYRLENAGSLERLAQSEPPYKMTDYGDEIPYHLAFYRNSFGEMDLDE